jgi:hypothetical protein
MVHVMSYGRLRLGCTYGLSGSSFLRHGWFTVSSGSILNEGSGTMDGHSQSLSFSFGFPLIVAWVNVVRILLARIRNGSMNLHHSSVWLKREMGDITVAI